MPREFYSFGRPLWVLPFPSIGIAESTEEGKKIIWATMSQNMLYKSLGDHAPAKKIPTCLGFELRQMPFLT